MGMQSLEIKQKLKLLLNFCITSCGIIASNAVIVSHRDSNRLHSFTHYVVWR